MNAKYIMLIFSLIVSFSACEQKIDLDLPQAEIKPVVYGLACAGKPIKVTVQKSITTTTFSDTLDLHILVDISLYVNEVFQEKLNYKNQLYQSNYIPKTGDLVGIKFNWQGENIEATVQIPQSVKIDSVVHRDKVYFDNLAGEFFQGLQLYFSDLANSEDYYEVGIRTFSKDTDGTAVVAQASEYSSQDPIIVQEDIVEYEPNTLVFSDLLFNGKQANPTFNFYLRIINEPEWYDSRLYLLKISKEYYEYQKKLAKNQWAQRPDMFNGSIEFVNVPSNVKNAYGIFKGYSIDSVDIHKIL